MSTQIKYRDNTVSDFSRMRLHKSLLKIPRAPQVAVGRVAQTVEESLPDSITEEELQDYTAAVCEQLISVHPAYGKFGARVLLRLWRRTMPRTFLSAMQQAHSAGLVSDEFLKRVAENSELIEQELNHDYDDRFSATSLRVLAHNYLLKVRGKTVELPQYMYMRVAIALNPNSIADAMKTYHLLGEGWYSHATPTLFNAGKPAASQQLSSCFLLQFPDDLKEMSKVAGDLLQMAKNAGGIGTSFSLVRPKGSLIRSSGCASDGIVPALKYLAKGPQWINQGGKRQSNMAVYLDITHPEVLKLAQARTHRGDHTARIPEIFPAVGFRRLFFEKVQKNEDWHFFDPSRVPEEFLTAFDDLTTGENKFTKMYEELVAKGEFVEKVSARELFSSIAMCCMLSGTPYGICLDTTNSVSMQKGLGYIALHNLCVEIPLITSPDEYGVCVLSSVILPRYVRQDKSFDYDKLHEVVRHVARVLYNAFDVQSYPCPEAEYGAKARRAIGIGIMGLADALVAMRIPMSKSAKIQRMIMETIYHAFLCESLDLAKLKGAFQGWEETPYAKGLLEHDLYCRAQGISVSSVESGRYDWEAMRRDVQIYGVAMSLGVALMPTASTAKIAGGSESFEPKELSVQLKLLSGSYTVLDADLVNDLEACGVWNDEVRIRICTANSVQGINEIPDDLKELYRTGFELSPALQVRLAAARAPFVDQAQSQNIYFPRGSDTNVVMNAIAMGHAAGLRTLLYYARQQPAQEAGAHLAHPICVSCSA